MLAGEQRALGSRAIAIGAAQAVLWTVLSVAVIVASSAVGKTFTDFGRKLPEMTRAVFGFALLLRHYWYFGLLAACCWPFANWGVVSLLSPSPDAFILRRLWYLATWIVPIVAVIFALAALMIPLMALHHHVS
jgi:hypothetical protein